MITTIIQHTGVLDCFFGLQPTMKPPSAIHLSSASNFQNTNNVRYTIHVQFQPLGMKITYNKI